MGRSDKPVEATRSEVLLEEIRAFFNETAPPESSLRLGRGGLIFHRFTAKLFSVRYGF